MVTVSGGTAEYSLLSIEKSSGCFQLAFTSVGRLTAYSKPFSVDPLPPSSLSFVTLPGGAAPGRSLTTQPVIFPPQMPPLCPSRVPVHTLLYPPPPILFLPSLLPSLPSSLSPFLSLSPLKRIKSSKFLLITFVGLHPLTFPPSTPPSIFLPNAIRPSRPSTSLATSSARSLGLCLSSSTTWVSLPTARVGLCGGAYTLRALQM